MGIMAENTFPSVKVDVLVTLLRTEVLSGQEAKQFTKSDLTPSPKPETVQRLYTRVLQVVCNIRPDSHYMLPLNENLQYSGLHEATIPVLSVYLHMSRLLPVCRVYDFQLSDVLNPKAKRTIYILSGIVNFLNFRKIRMEMSSEYHLRFRGDMDRWQALNVGIKEAERKIAKLTIVPPEQQAEDKQLSEALNELQNATKHHYQEVNNMNQKNVEVKAEIAELSQKLTQRKLDVATLKEEIVKLKSQIVESPEELKSEMDKLKEKVKNLKSAKEKANSSFVEWQIKIQAKYQSKAELQLLHKLLRDLEAGMDKMNGMHDEIKSLEALYEEMNKTLRNQSTEEAQLKRTLGLKTDKLSKQQIRRQKKREMKKQHVENILGLCDQVQQKREDIVDQMQEINKDTKQIKQKIQSLQDLYHQESEKAQALYDRLLSNLDHFHKRIESQVVQASEDMERMKAHY